MLLCMTVIRKTNVIVNNRGIVMEDYEKKYKNALEKAKSMIDDLRQGEDILAVSDLEEMFPELKESEDERIRKALIRFHKSTIDVDGIKGDDIIAWLEKQGESYTKKDVDDAYLKGISDAKNELEKQCEQKPFDYEKATITQKDFAPKPTEWSEEDENYLQSAENACEYQYGKNTSTILGLKSLKNRMQGKEEKK